MFFLLGKQFNIHRVIQFDQTNNTLHVQWCPSLDTPCIISIHPQCGYACLQSPRVTVRQLYVHFLDNRYVNVIHEGAQCYFTRKDPSHSLVISQNKHNKLRYMFEFPRKYHKNQSHITLYNKSPVVFEHPSPLSSLIVFIS